MRLADTKRDLNGKELAETLRSAASAVTHGRHRTARTKIETAFLNSVGGVGKEILLVTRAEADTILAALRLWTYEENAAHVVDGFGLIADIASANGDALTNEQTDNLGDRISGI